jgi:predicted nucleic acid-binding protein
MNDSLVCVDASIVVDRILGFDEPQLWAQWDVWIKSGAQLIAPRLIYYETTNAIYQIGKKSQLSPEAMAEAIQMLLTLPIKLFADLFLHSIAFALARELAFGATYDAHYLALAKQSDCEFWTRDARLARAAQQKYDWVRLLL